MTKLPKAGGKFYLANGHGIVEEYSIVGNQHEKTVFEMGRMFEHTQDGLIAARERSDKGLLSHPGTYWHDDVGALKEFHEQFQRYEIDAATLAEKVQSFVEKYS